MSDTLAFEKFMQQWDNNPPLLERYKFAADNPMEPVPLAQDRDSERVLWVVTDDYLREVVAIRERCAQAEKTAAKLAARVGESYKPGGDNE